MVSQQFTILKIYPKIKTLVSLWEVIGIGKNRWSQGLQVGAVGCVCRRVPFVWLQAGKAFYLHAGKGLQLARGKVLKQVSGRRPHFRGVNASAVRVSQECGEWWRNGGEALQCAMQQCWVVHVTEKTDGGSTEDKSSSGQCDAGDSIVHTTESPVWQAWTLHFYNSRLRSFESCEY